LNNVLHSLKIANFPLHWEDKIKVLNDPKFKIERYEIDLSSDEAVNIEKQFSQTVPGKKMVRIERI